MIVLLVARGAQRAPLLFDHSQAENIKSDKPETEKVLNEICAKSAGGDIPGDAAERFSSLVHLVRRLSEKDIRDLLNKAGACSSPKAKYELLI